ncbi:MAG: DUF4924 family protein [Bacteroidales bacterium]|nr:DUF4924 family protein [Bacteroidales bacterium]
MFIAKELKEKNVCEYLLYMWQIEDTIRAFNFDLDRIKTEYVSRFQYPDAQREEEEKWFGYLIDMMRQEDVMEKGHLQMNQGTLALLTDKHLELLNDTDQTAYNAAYYRALPFIVELRAHGDKQKPELATCLEALYGVMMLRLQKKEVSEGTQKAVQRISEMLALLCKK